MLREALKLATLTAIIPAILVEGGESSTTTNILRRFGYL